jgi:acetylornithine deacetylase/succinyl-diaminopimelate desuccinylase-like protein
VRPLCRRRAAVTDSRHFLPLCPNGALRFTPYTARRAAPHSDYKRLHGVDERVRIRDFACGLLTYRAAVKGFGQLLDDGQGEGFFFQQQQQQHSEL